MAHSKGPWIAAAAPSSIVGWPIVNGEGRLICRLGWLPRSADCSDADWQAFMDECKANARLIAAAPDLLEQLRNLVGLAKMRGGNLHEYGAAIRNAEAVIAKASAA